LDPRPAASDTKHGVTVQPTSPLNLPVQLTSFVGRQQELAQAPRLLGESRLLTPWRKRRERD
jgi:hypothetical protein